jgi:hypothetical protein
VFLISGGQDKHREAQLRGRGKVSRKIREMRREKGMLGKR